MKYLGMDMCIDLHKKVRKASTILAGALLLGSAVPGTARAVEAASGYIVGSVKYEGVNIRSSSSGIAEVLGRAYEGQNLTILGSEGGFFRVRTSSYGEGFIAKDFVRLDAIGVVRQGGVNVREGASIEYPIIKAAPEGQNFNITGGADEWFRVILEDGGTAYIFRDFLGLYSSGEVAGVTHVNEAPPESPTNYAYDIPADIEMLLSILLEHFPDTVLDTMNNEKEHEPPIVAQETAWWTQQIPENNAATVPLVDLPLHAGGNQPGQPGADAAFAVVSYSVGVPFLDAPYGERLQRNLYPTKILEVLATIPGWARVASGDVQGYVNLSYITMISGDRQTPPPANPLRAQAIINYAQQFLGTPYIFGGTDLNMGVDCSGFIFSVMLVHDIALGRSSRDMFNNGTPVPRNYLEPGDLLFFSSNGRVVTHVALYIGNDQYIHSTDFRDMGVSFARLSSDYSQRTYFGARRVIE